MKPTKAQCEYMHPDNHNESLLCKNNATFWLRRGPTDMLVCGSHLALSTRQLALEKPTTLKTTALPLTHQSQITVQTITTNGEAYPKQSPEFRVLKSKGKA